MSERISLKEAERKAFTSAYQDGLWDIFVGCIVLQLAIAPFLSRSLGDFWSSVVFLPLWAMVLLAIWLVRKHVVTPRVGVVRFGSWRKTRLVKFNLVMFVVLVAGLILGILSARDFSAVAGWIPAVRFSLIMLIGFSVAAYFLDFTRLYVYGVLFALSPVAGEWLYVRMRIPHHGFPVTFGISAGIAILVGFGKFIHLLREYPIPAEESPSEGA
jgi:hypothetical protein